MKRNPLQTPGNLSSGFSLIELAVVLLIIGTLMSGVLVAVSSSAENARITNAKAQLRTIEEALYGFAQAVGRLPCPATDDSLFPGVEESPCNDMHGFVPAVTLGIDGPVNSDGLLVDPWQNPLRYSLITDFSDATSISNLFNLNTVLGLGSLLRVCADSTCAQTLADPVPAVVLSMGANWATYTSTNETTNAGDQSMNGYPIKDDNIFVSTTYSEENFDDQVVWLSPYVLFNRLVSAGKLP